MNQDRNPSFSNPLGFIFDRYAKEMEHMLNHPFFQERMSGRTKPTMRTIDDSFPTTSTELTSTPQETSSEVVATPSETNPLTMDLQVHETDTNIVVHADVPGVRKEDIEVILENMVLTVRASRHNTVERSDESKGFYHCERSFGSVSRTVHLHSHVDENSTSLELENGVLTITLTKTPDTNRKTFKLE